MSNTRPSIATFARAKALAALGLALPVLAHAACQIHSFELPVKMVGSRAVVTVGINGTQVPLTVDSGAFYSSLTDAAAEQLKLPTYYNSSLRVEGLTGKIETSVATVDKLQLFNGEIPRVEFVVGGNEPGAGTMGLLGRNLLSFTDTEYDLAHGVIRFSFPSDGCDEANMAYWAGAAPVAEIDLMRDRRNAFPALRAKVKLNDATLVALFDTGATTVVSTRGAERAGVAEADMKPSGTVYGAGKGSSKSWTAMFDKFELGGETISHNRLFVTQFRMEDADILIGVDFFLSHRVYISKKQARMFFTYSGGPVFALDKGEDAPPAGSADAAASGAAALTAAQLAARGAASASRRDYASALADLDRACELDATSAPCFAQRGVVHEALRHPAKALEDFDKALALDPTEADARLRRAWLRYAAKDGDGAKADLDALDTTLAPQAQMRLSMARLYDNVALPDQALAQLNRWLASHPYEVRRDNALNTRCWIRARLGIELQAALADCDNALDSDSKNSYYLDSRGWVYLRLGNYEKALSDFDRSIGIRPESAWPLYGRGLTRTRMGDAARGDADLAAARKLLPDIDRKVAEAGLTTQPAPKR